MIIIGYISGVTGKLISGNITYVLAFYAVDILLVSTDLILTFRNRKLDRMRDKEA